MNFFHLIIVKYHKPSKMFFVSMIENTNKTKSNSKSKTLNLLCDYFLQKICEDFINESGRVNHVNMNMISSVLKG